MSESTKSFVLHEVDAEKAFQRVVDVASGLFSSL